MADGAQGVGAAVDPEGILRSALEKIVFFECRVSQLESELEGTRAVAERARADAAEARRREVELAQSSAAERGAREDAQARADDLFERVRLLEGERERLLSGLVERARLDGAAGSDGAPGPEEGGADLAGFIAELRAEIEALRAWKAAAEAAGIRVGGQTVPVLRGERVPESMPAVAERFRAEGRVGLSGRDAERLKDLLTTRADRVLYESSMDDLAASDARVRMRAVRALEALGARTAAPLLCAALGRESDPAVKAAILGTLGRFEEPFAAEVCQRALSDPRPVVRVAALEALSAVAPAEAESRVSAALSDESPLVRRRAALLLGFTKGDRAEAALSAALGDPDRGVARAAAAALSGRPTARAQGALTRALEHPDPSVRRAAAASLARVAGEPVQSEGSAPSLRAASRRIAARLAAMDPPALREAVLAGTAAPPADPVPATPALSEAALVPSPLSARTAGQERAGSTARDEALPGGAVRSGDQRSPPPFAQASPAAAPARPAARVAVEEVPAQVDPTFETALLAELRSSLRGCDPPELSAAVGAPVATVSAALCALRARGAAVQRGARWFTA